MNEKPRSWRVNWLDVNDHERLAWFQATRRSGGAPEQWQEVVAAEDYDALRVCLEEVRQELSDERDRSDLYARTVASFADLGEAAEAEVARLREALREANDVIHGGGDPEDLLRSIAVIVGAALSLPVSTPNSQEEWPSLELAGELRGAARRMRAGGTLDADVCADLLGQAAWWLDRLGKEADLPPESPQFDDHYEGHGTPPEDWV